MKLAIFEDAKSENFFPLALSRPVFELRNGFCSLAEKICRQFPAAKVGYFCREYLEPTVKTRLDGSINDSAFLKGDDLLLVNGRLMCNDFRLSADGPSHLVVKGDNVAYLYIEQKDLPADADAKDLAGLLDRARMHIKITESNDAPLAEYIWDVMLANGEGLLADFKFSGKSGIEGKVEEPSAIRGSKDQIFIGEGT